MSGRRVPTVLPLTSATFRAATIRLPQSIALEKSLALLKKDGLLCICIYSGGDTGFAERDAVLDWLKALDSKKYLVLLTQYYNRPNNPPIPAFVIRL